VVGSRLRSEVPMLAHRIRKAVVRNGAKLAILESRPQELLFPVEASLSSNGLGMVEHLGAVLLAALRAQGEEVPAALQSALAGLQANEGHSRAAGVLAGDGLRLILLGATAQRHPAYSAIHALAVALAEASGARLGWLPEGGNAVGAALAGVLPHRGLGGQPLAVPGMAAGEMLAAGLDGYLLVGALEREDFADGAVAAKALSGAGCVVALSPYEGEFLRSHASVILPVAAYAETSGSWVNVEGTWQSVAGAARPPGEARPGWKVLRVLGNLLNLPDFEYLSSEQVRDELRRALDELAPVQPAAPAMPATLTGQGTAAEVGIYAVDAVVRRSQPLQATRLAADEGTA
jgi:NADH-quinone oxidoreductase subunit G